MQVTSGFVYLGPWRQTSIDGVGVGLKAWSRVIIVGGWERLRGGNDEVSLNFQCTGWIVSA